MEKIKVLAISPYSGLEKLIFSVAVEFPQLDITVRTGDLEIGLHTALDSIRDKYDFILTRGGTADLISSQLSIPVVRVPISGYDFMRTVKLSQIYSDKAAVVGFPDITNGAETARELLDSDLDIFTIHSVAECEATVLRLKNEGYRIILGDTITQRIAAKHSLNAIIITSGRESVHEALSAIVYTSSISCYYMEKNQILQNIVENCGCYTRVFNSKGETIFCNLPPEIKDSQEILWLGNPAMETRLSIFKSCQKNWQAHCVVAHGGDTDETFRIVYCRELEYDGGPEPLGVTVHNLELHQIQVQEQLNLFSSETLRRASILSKAEVPVLIVGEPGTGKNALAHIIHLESPHRKNPFVQIDCRFVDDASFHDFLCGKLFPVERDESLPKSTLYLKALDRLPEPLQNELCSSLDSGNPFSSYILIASSYTDLDELALAKHFNRDILDILGFSRLPIPPLRERTEDLRGMFGLLINRNNERYGKQITGITPEAAEIILSYSWPGNTNQLSQAFEEMVMLSDESIIEADAAASAVKKQYDKSAAAANIYYVPEGRTLDEITGDIIRIVLKNENGNQSAAAAKLGIGRSTLWRRLKLGDQEAP